MNSSGVKSGVGNISYMNKMDLIQPPEKMRLNKKISILQYIYCSTCDSHESDNKSERFLMFGRSARFLVLILFLLPAVLSCVGTVDSSDDEMEENSLVFVQSYQLPINDPSGLVIDMSGDFLWTISDDPGEFIYKISFTGQVLGFLEGYLGDDMEGITMNPNDGTLWIAEEKLRKIVQVSTTGEVLQIIEIPVDATNPNDGLEGITWNPLNNHVYVVNEKNPRQFIELDTNFDVVRSVTINFDGEFTLRDLSGLFYDHIRDEIWILSDESERIVITDQQLKPLRSYDLGKDKFEGIAVDLQTYRVYLVNDRDNRLYVYDLKK